MVSGLLLLTLSRVPPVCAASAAADVKQREAGWDSGLLSWSLAVPIRLNVRTEQSSRRARECVRCYQQTKIPNVLKVIKMEGK